MPVTANQPALIYQRYFSALIGPTGPLGGTGPVGVAGATGIGPTGPKGYRGYYNTGPTGPSGVTGFTGPLGWTGPQGFGSETGPQGDGGDWGIDGPTGDTGSIGPTGHLGPGGNAPTGITGVSGSTGTGDYGGTDAPFFYDSEVFLTTPTLGVANQTGSPWGFGSTNLFHITLVPVFVPFARTFTEIAVEVAQTYYPTIGIQLGIYDCGADMHPTLPLFDSGLIAPLGKGRMTAAFSLALQAKPYYLAISANQAVSIRTFSAAYVVPTLGMKRYSPIWGTNDWMFETVALDTTAGGSWGSPSPFPDLSALTIGDRQQIAPSNFPLILGIR